MIVPSTKARFQKNANAVNKHAALLDLPEMERALDTAFQEYTELACDGNDPNWFYRIQGVRQFILIFKTLHAPPAKLPRKPTDNLSTNQ